ncbi:bifunctional hydroxymethylpyrimidine kinase/phosphomethylpyrimidine kinase [Motilimonas pumila]|uniref:hydroxymethylpyrimidine kinase n=1 Tax=Motilimonas pumila TaxID=2303987 RepID=A0A418YHQ2_9GAMM|nr:bifunctional hydroxymethylpyrimidine kinase/phosphomethylpyrimidine kinase [Motilimonas pumila]RJG49920.1 bifunctional hydroxymethylpyrimidine kinase/phosphomethylpyrimidine kinase [Motilimonas pumila]
MSKHVQNVLTIATSDSCGGAGVQADIKAISATGCYAASVLVALTAQNTQAVSAIHTLPLDFIEQQIDSIFADMNIASVKLGMLFNRDIIALIAKKLKQYDVANVVIDPVMVSAGGDKLLQDDAVQAYLEQLLPLATVMTPNAHELAVLLNEAPTLLESDLLQQAKQWQQSYPTALMIKGGGLQDSQHSNDYFVTPQQITTLIQPRIHTQNTHGTGCSLAAALASYLAQGQPLIQAVKSAQKYVHKGLLTCDQLAVGKGKGPIQHFFELHI